MSILIVPTNYPTIQSALNAATSYDTIQILSGVYEESLSLIGTDNVTITGQGQNVLIDGSTFTNTVAFNISANNTTVSGLSFGYFGAGILVNGNNNNIINVNSAYMKLWGYLVQGNNNSITQAQIQNNGEVGIELVGEYNIIEKCTIMDNPLGINSQMEPCLGNLIFNCTFLRNSDYSIKLNALNADQNILIDNNISYSRYGILVSVGRAAIVDTVITYCTDVGIQLTDNGNIVLQNTLINNPNGMILSSDNSLFCQNNITKGTDNGMTISGNYDTIISNAITGYDKVGLLLSGSNSIVSNNILDSNGINLINNGLCNDFSNSVCYTSKFDWYNQIIQYESTGNFSNFTNVFNNSSSYFLSSCPSKCSSKCHSKCLNKC